MHSFLRMRSALWAGFCAVVLSAIVAGVAEAKPRPGNPNKGFRLFARPLGALVINRIYCGLASTGEICVDSTNSSTIGGGFWPKGTADQYVFNSGIQVAGLIGPDANPEWAGDTTSAQFFSPRGDSHGEEIRPIFNSSNPDDVANWPQAAKVPQGDASELLFNPLLRGRVSASQGDVWFLSWEGNPAFAAGREHPLGILVEQRGMGYNFPSGNEDILYFIYTFYNVTARDPAAYAPVRDGMRQILEEAGARFQSANEARFNISIPDGGYTINNFFAAFGADMDVSEAGANYASVNVPFSLGYTYESSFAPASGWTFDPSIFSPPFFAGSGFVGVKYLKSPIDPLTGNEVGLTLFSNTINGGAFDDASNATQLYRYLSNNISVAAGDAACNTGDPRATKICYINNGGEDDMRFFQASGPLQLAPGAFGSIVVAYIFAAPRIVGACVGPGTCVLKPGDATRLSDAGRLTSEGANAIDSVTGFVGFRGADLNGNVVQDSITTLPGSLLGKALVAQEVFRNAFLLPFAPDAPNFFLIPQDNQVTVFWQPSPSETTGDPFFAIANAPNTPEGAINPLYDPNYRQLDVEGYRVYRGRVDSPNSLQLLAQFDYAGTVISDFEGQVNPTPLCAPELGITAECAVAFDPVIPGTARTEHVDVPLVGPIIQVKLGERTALATGQAIVLKADTAITGAASGCLRLGATAECPLRDTGVPFVYVDGTARNNLRYFYAVTAFDLNSFQSGPSSIESPRNTKAIIPVRPAGNFVSTGTTTTRAEGRGVRIDTDTTLPTIDPVTGIFSKKFPVANNASLAFVGEFVKSIFSVPGEFSAKLVGIGLGDARNGVPVNYTWQATATTGQQTIFNVQVAQPLNGRAENTVVVGPPFPAAAADDQLSSRFGMPAGFVAAGLVNQGVVGYTAVNSWGRGLFDGSIRAATGTTGALYNGPRWFQGANETKADPNGANNEDVVNGVPTPSGPNNSGELPGVAIIQLPISYLQVDGGGRALDAVTSGAVRAADFNVYWNAGGLVDSVVDMTHNVVVPFMADSVGGGWGFLNQAAGAAGGSLDNRGAVLTFADFGCVEPLKSLPGSAGYLPCTAATPYLLSATAVPGPVAIFTGTTSTAAPATAQAADPGFGMWLAGHIFMFKLAPGGALPATGTVWTMRSYIGTVSGGNGAGGALGPYRFTARPRTFSAIGAEFKISFSASNVVSAASESDLGRVHTVPDPYYVTNAFEQTTDSKVLKFVNLPNDCIIRIYSSSGVLVSLLEHHTTTFGGSEDWNVRNRNNQVVASGVYFYHIEAGDARRVGRFTVVNFAQ